MYNSILTSFNYIFIMKINFQQTKNKYYKNLQKTILRIDNSLRINNDDETEQQSDNKLLLTSNNTKVNKTAGIKCEKCLENEYKYICPKCKIKYCGVKCFKIHSTECTEEFYKKNVMQELKNQKVSEEQANLFKSKLKTDYEKKKENSTETDFQPILTSINKKRLNKIFKLIEQDGDNFDYAKELMPNEWEEFMKYINQNMKFDLYIS